MSRFEQTQWSIVLRAGDGSADAGAALEALCRAYRSPVLAYVQGRTHNADKAEDLTQAFFARFLERGWVCDADPDRGRFRSFLLTALQRFLSDANSEATALKRGGGLRIESLDDAEEGCTDAGNPEREFERAWAWAVVDKAFKRLRAEAGAADKLALFERLSEFLIERPDDADYAQAAEALHLRRNTVAVAVHRLRHRLRELVCAELAETTASCGDAQGELRALCESLGMPAP